MADIKYFTVTDRLTIDDLQSAFGSHQLGREVLFEGFVSVLAVDNAKKYISSYNVRVLGDSNKRVSILKTDYQKRTIRMKVVPRAMIEN